MKTFTSTLPDDLFLELGKLAERFSLPKNRIIEKALGIYIDQIRKAEYIQSYKQASGDIDILQMAEEGMVDYLNQLNNETM
jgi:predicted transcriptional regulator